MELGIADSRQRKEQGVSQERQAVDHLAKVVEGVVMVGDDGN